jgi:pentatricopeptide repeat protein
MYSSCGLTDLSKRVFDTAPYGTCDIVSWNSMVSGYLDNNLLEEALLVFTKMVNGLVQIDEISPINALIACAKLGLGKVGKQIHTLIVVNGFDLNCYLGSALVSMYAQCGFTNDAHVVFDRMPDRNVVCWGALIAGYVRFGKYREAMELFRQMQLASVKPDDATMATIISLCAHVGAVNQGRHIHAYCDILGLSRVLTVQNALIDMYSKCGDIKEGYKVFSELTTRDVFSWTSMISGMAMNGCCTEALHLFEQMEREGEVKPNEVTLLGVLSACSHGGFVQKGYFHFDRMYKIYNLRPKIEHFGCMVDLLGRAKLIKEAYEFIENMPILPDTVIWRALLFACWSSREIKMAKYVADKIVELDSNSNIGVRVMLSNVYAASSLWGDVRTIRGFMENQNEHKVPGCSFIEIDGIVHEFFAGDMSHGETESIYQALRNLVNCCFMKDAFA